MRPLLLIPGFTAVAIACGAVLFLLGMWHESGFGTSAWLGFVAALFVGIGLALLAVLLHLVPIAAAAFFVASRSLFASISLWVVLSVIVLFLANAAMEPARILDFGFFVPMGALYGSVSGVAFWLFAGLNAP